MPTDMNRLAQRVDGLPPEERRVLRLLYGLDGAGPLDSSEAAATVGITVPQLHEIRARGLALLREVEA